MIKSITYVSVALLLAACRPEPQLTFSDSISIEEALTLPIPNGFPVMPQPPENVATQSRVDLGKLLFEDPRLSRDGSVSCSSCHIPSLAFTDGEQISPGIEGRRGMRNSPTLANVGWQELLFMDGGLPSLEQQAIAPIMNEQEMDHNLVLISETLMQDEALNAMAQRAYRRDLDPYVITRALAAYERTLISGNSAYDLYLAGTMSAMSQEAIAGMDLFFSDRTSCGSCHSGFLLTDQSYRNIGLYEEYLDPGRKRVTGDPHDIGKFKVPTLRNIAITAPYMHDGSMQTLDEVVNHFDAGGHDHPLKDESIKALNLTLQEKGQLIAFLEALTDKRFVTSSDLH